MKDLLIVIPGAQDENESRREITIKPGTTAADILQACGLEGYFLSKDGGSTFFTSDEDVYKQVESGAKLFATSDVKVGW